MTTELDNVCCDKNNRNEISCTYCNAVQQTEVRAA